jgi:CheY-specific phosphatase CheX
LAQKNPNEIKIVVVMSNLDMRLATTQFLSRKSWTDVRNVLGFELTKTLLADEKFDVIFIDGEEASGGTDGFLKTVRSSKRNQNSLVICVHAEASVKKDEDLLKDKLFRFWSLPITDVTLDELKADVEDFRVKSAAAMQAQNAAVAKTFDVRLLNAVILGVREVLDFYFDPNDVDFGKPNYRKQPLLERSGITGLIGIQGDKFKGSMALAASLDFLQHLSNKFFPDQDIKLTKESSMDLIAELSNQVVGRVKMRFGDLGLHSNIGLPEVFIGKNHAVPHTVVDTAIFMGLKVLGSLCELELTISQAADFLIDETKSVSSTTGSLMFE